MVYRPTCTQTDPDDPETRNMHMHLWRISNACQKKRLKIIDEIKHYWPGTEKEDWLPRRLRPDNMPRAPKDWSSSYLEQISILASHTRGDMPLAHKHMQDVSDHNIALKRGVGKLCSRDIVTAQDRRLKEIGAQNQREESKQIRERKNADRQKVEQQRAEQQRPEQQRAERQKAEREKTKRQRHEESDDPDDTGRTAARKRSRVDRPALAGSFGRHLDRGDRRSNAQSASDQEPADAHMFSPGLDADHDSRRPTSVHNSPNHGLYSRASPVMTADYGDLREALPEVPQTIPSPADLIASPQPRAWAGNRQPNNALAVVQHGAPSSNRASGEEAPSRNEGNESTQQNHKQEQGQQQNSNSNQNQHHSHNQNQNQGQGQGQGQGFLPDTLMPDVLQQYGPQKARAIQYQESYRDAQGNIASRDFKWIHRPH